MFILYLNQFLHLDLPNLQLNVVSGLGSNYFHHILMKEYSTMKNIKQD